MLPPDTSIATGRRLEFLRSGSLLGLWGSQLAATAGDAVLALTSVILGLQLTGSILSMAAVMAASTLPTMLLGALAAVVTDRSDHKQVIVASHLLRAGLVLAIPLLAPLHIAWLFVLVALASGLRQFVPPAEEELIPHLCNQQVLAATASARAATPVVAAAIGSAAAGALATWATSTLALQLDAGLFTAGAVLMLAVRVPRLPHHVNTGLGAVASNLRRGLRAIRADPALRTLSLVALVVALTSGLWEGILLPFVVRALNASDAVYGFQQGLTSIGFLVGSLVVAAGGSRVREGQWIVLALVTMGLLGVLYSSIDAVPPALVIVLVVGAAQAPFGLSRRVTVRRSAAREDRPRVDSTMVLGINTFFTVGMALTGLADMVPLRSVVLAVALVTLATGLVAAALPGFGRPGAEWLRAVQLLREAGTAAQTVTVRPAGAADFDELTTHLAVLSELPRLLQRDLSGRSLVVEAPAGTTVVKKGEASDAAYFVLEGRLVAGWREGERVRPLEILSAGDFFGEIAAMRGGVRTADVVTEEPARMLKVPAPVLRVVAQHPVVMDLLRDKIDERLRRMELADLPRLGTSDQRGLVERDEPSTVGQR